MTRRSGERGAGPKDEREPSREAPSDERQGPDWEPSGPEWAPPPGPQHEAPPGAGAPAHEREARPGAPAKAGDPPLEHPFGERSRHGGRLPRGRP